jgi:thiol:disulfide interchange protein DsbC
MYRIILSLLVAGAIGWQAALADHETDPAIARSMEKVIPGMKPDRVSHSPIPGVYELVFGPHILYVTKDGRYMLQGDLFDVTTRQNLTTAKRKQARIDVVNSLDEKDMIVFGPKKAKYTVTVFTDIDCPYCQKLHSQISEYNDRGIKVRYLAFPRAGIPSASYDKTVSVWCADDRQQAMTDAKAGKAVPSKRCDNPVRQHYELGQMVGVKGTPTLILENGDIVPGYVPPSRLAAMLDARFAGLAPR